MGIERYNRNTPDTQPGGNPEKARLLAERERLNAELRTLNEQLSAGGVTLNAIDLTEAHKTAMKKVTGEILGEIARINLALVKLDTELEQLDVDATKQAPARGVWNDERYFGGRPE